MNILKHSFVLLLGLSLVVLLAACQGTVSTGPTGPAQPNGNTPTSQPSQPTATSTSQPMATSTSVSKLNCGNVVQNANPGQGSTAQEIQRAEDCFAHAYQLVSTSKPHLYRSRC